MLHEELEKYVLKEMNACIGCNECMAACPVTKNEELSIALLNDAIINNDSPKGIVKDFIFNCVQCGRCVPVCPAGVRRDLMVLYTRSKATSLPGSYDSYIRLKQPKMTTTGKSLYAIKKRAYKKSLGKLYESLDRPIEELHEANLLFYPGCYVFNDVCQKTAAILDYLKEDWEILSGYTTCCGWPHYLQGRLEMAEEYFENLWYLIKKVNPKKIITSCAECFAALRKIKSLFQADFIPMTTTDYFLENIDQIPLVKFDKTMGFHDSCHISRKARKYETPRSLANIFGDLKELPNNLDDAMCCYYYNFSHDKANDEFRRERINEVKQVAEVMLTDCITCNEVYKEKMEKEGLEIIDFNDLVFNCIKDKVDIQISKEEIPKDAQEI